MLPLFIDLNVLYTVIFEYIFEFIGVHLTNNAIFVFILQNFMLSQPKILF